MLDTLAAVKCHAKRDAHALRTVRNACVRALAVCALLTSGAAMEPRAGPDLNDVADVLRSWQAGPSCNELGQLVGGALRMLCNGDQCQLIDIAQGLVTGLACDHLTIVPRPPPRPSSPPPPSDEVAADSLIQLSNSPAKKRQRFESDRDSEAAAVLLQNIRTFVQGPLATRGTRPAALQVKADILAEVLHSSELQDRNLMSAAARLTGFDREVIKRGGALAADNAERGRRDQALGGQRATRSDCVDLDWVWEWFHTHSPDVEPDKSRKFRYKRKRARVAGKVRDLTCELRILTRKRHEAIDTFLASPEYNAFEKSTGQSLHPKTVGKCICPCMKSDKRNDCACPICTAMHHRLHAWNMQRSDWHKGGECSCSLDCKNPESSFRQMSRGFGLFMDAITCPRRPHPGLEMPHAPAEPPKFRPLRCCCQPKSRGRHQPDHVTLCTECGWDKKLGGGCPAEYTDDPCTWKRPTTVDAGNGRQETRYVDHRGTRKELLDEIKEASREFNYHQWIREWTKWMFKLDIATFNGTREILVLTDFAAVYDMSGKDVSTCEHGISCHQLVALVLHSPDPKATGAGPERPVVCDYWRVWGNHKGDAAFHQSVMRQIATHYKAKIPTLRRIKVWSDGQRAQYKGQKNFGRMATWPKSISVGGLELEIWHNFFASYHGSGQEGQGGGGL